MKKRLVPLLVLLAHLSSPSHAECPRTAAQWSAWIADRSAEIERALLATQVLEPEQLAETERCLSTTQDRAIKNCASPLLAFQRYYFARLGKLNLPNLPPELKDPTFSLSLGGGLGPTLSFLNAANNRRGSLGKPWIEVLPFVKGLNHGPTAEVNAILLYFPAEGDVQETWAEIHPGQSGLNPFALVLEISKGEKPVAKYGQFMVAPGGRAGALPLEPNHSASRFCRQCHLSGGPRAIHSTTESRPLEGSLIRLMNKRIADYGIVGPEVREPIPEGLPRFGDAVGNPALFPRCAPSLPPTKAKTLLEAMNCSSCHDGQLRSPLIPPFDLSRSGSLGQMVRFGHMPPKHSLNQAESSALLACLTLDYLGDSTSRGKLFRHLTGRSCSPPVPFSPQLIRGQGKPNHLDP